MLNNKRTSTGLALGVGAVIVTLDVGLVYCGKAYPYSANHILHGTAFAAPAMGVVAPSLCESWRTSSWTHTFNAHPGLRIHRPLDTNVQLKRNPVTHISLKKGNGSHPFDCGDRYMREVNIRNGWYNLDLQDSLGDYTFEAKDSIAPMLQTEPKNRPTAKEIP
ncbi:uncharacterized protein FFB14_15751 [Fusarium fujikuroi]|nr:uncharacterized protein FFB14_15751 [Fusarium fujikuroi]